MFALALWEIHQGVAGERDRWHPIGLGAEPGIVLRRPLSNRNQVALVNQLGKCLAPVVPHGGGHGSNILYQCGQVGCQIVTAPIPELFQQVVSPVGAIHFEAVAEYGIRRSLSECRHQTFANSVQVVFDGCSIKVVENKTFCAAGWTLYRDRKSTRLNSSHSQISYAVFCLKKKMTSARVPS